MIKLWLEQKKYQRISAQLFQPYGNLYDYDRMDERTKKVYVAFQSWGELLGQRIIRKQRINCNYAFGIIDSANIRAFATKSKGGYLVGVTAGTIHYLYNFCKAMLSSRFAFPFIERKVQKVEFDLDPRKVAIYAPILQVPDSENEEIRILSSNMFSFCAAFVIKHELAHVLAGHVDYNIARGGVDLIDAPLELLNEALPRPDAQAMEIYADGLSFYEYMIFAIERALSEPVQPIENWFAQGNSEVPAGPFSAYSVFRALSALDRKYDPLSSSHPPSYVRARSLQLIAEKVLMKTAVPKGAMVRDFIEGPTRWAFDAFNDISGQNEGSFDELVQSEACLAAASSLLARSERLWLEEWKMHALLSIEGPAEIVFGARN